MADVHITRVACVQLVREDKERSWKWWSSCTCGWTSQQYASRSLARGAALGHRVVQRVIGAPDDSGHPD